jgi:hypothetical protein
LKKLGNHHRRVQERAHRAWPRAKKVLNSSRSELSVSIDDQLAEFGSMGQKRLIRVGKSIRKKVMPKYKKGYTKGLKTSVDEADRVGKKILAPLDNHHVRNRYKASQTVKRAERAEKASISAAVQADARSVKASIAETQARRGNRKKPWRAPSAQELSVSIDDQLLEFEKMGLAIEPISDKKKKSSGKVKSFESLDSQLDSILTEFADRKRDGGGRYAHGQSGAGVDDFRVAHGNRGKRKRLKRVAGVAALAGAGGLVAGTGMGRIAASRLRQGVWRGVSGV